MPLNLDAIGTTAGPTERSWTVDDSLLYALAVGAGYPDPTKSLAFTTENTRDTTLSALPTLGVIIGSSGGEVWRDIGTFNPALLVHAEQSITIHNQIPAAGTIATTTTLTSIEDKGSGALVTTEAVSTDAQSEEPMFTTRSSAFLRGEGGFDPDRKPSPKSASPFEGEPDQVVEFETQPNQALLYRLCGDRNPLHSDPSFAAIGGFERPILHGLCTYGFTGRALLEALCADETARFGSMSGRFTKPVMPGERLSISIWRREDGAAFQTAGSDGRIVIDRGEFTLR